MRQETNKEIDLLLRRMSRQNGGSLRDTEAHESHLGEHLDGDELSSYAQNALPAAARARYTEHLAECSTCRKLVTELSLSLGATAGAASPVETVVEASGLKKFLASLFSPMVLRYAVPALGLILVAAIGFVILRQRGQEDFVAQVDTNQKSTAPLTASEAPAPASSADRGLVDNAPADQPGRAANPKEAASKSAEVSGDAAGSGPAAPAPVTTTPRAEEAPPPPQTGQLPQPTPAPKIAAATESDDKRKAAEGEEQQKKDSIAKAPEPAVTVEKTDATVKSAKTNEQASNYNAAPQTGAPARADESKRESLPVQRRGTFGTATSAGRARAQDDAETRTVSGRRFRKERGIWTDTAYDSSTSTVNVARGSEQFRALVADEPEIKKIAEQLDGEVIVVWKGRAYRIR
ncbi:MAG TPA: hypothetical protein VFY61_13655 [Pyrinomonadaceae bacterium]|nr:hypothetical protein [Pyrinomonadaceae bacterium]